MGVGVDMVHIPSFEQQLRDGASSFIEKAFTPGERAYCQNFPAHRQAEHFAVRFAAKEALIKAWSGIYFNRPPQIKSVNLKEIEVIRDPWGRPRLKLHGQMGKLLRHFQSSLSLSHDGPSAIAYVHLYAHNEAQP